MNVYGFVGGDPVNSIDAYGLAQICNRALAGFPGQVGVFRHDQIFYKDGSNSGFFGDGKVRKDYGHDKSEYLCSDDIYDDDKLKEIEKNIKELYDSSYSLESKYNLISNNCQDYVRSVLYIYNHPVNKIKSTSER